MSSNTIELDETTRIAFMARLRVLLTPALLKANAEDVAAALGISGPLLSQLLNGVRPPTAGALLHLAKATGCSIDWLVGLKDKQGRTRLKVPKTRKRAGSHKYERTA